MDTPAGNEEKHDLIEEEDDIPAFSHEDLLKITRTTLNELLQGDSVLKDLPPDVTVDEVKAQIALAHGQSMTVIVIRADGEELSVIVKQKDATVLDLKKAICRHMTWKLNRQGERRKISWRYIWKTYHLQHDSERLTTDEALLHKIGIKNKSRVTFVKRLRAKGPVEKRLT